MSDYVFLFDLDSTITKKEILPEIAKVLNNTGKMRELTEATMRGEIPFRTSFLQRVELLKSVEVSYARKIVSNLPLNESLANFIRKNKDRCYIVTGNLDIWISDLIKKLNMDNHTYCSKAIESDDKIIEVIHVAEKKEICDRIKQPFVCIGDGDNDAGMAIAAKIAIGFGGVREIAPSLLRNVDFAFYDERRCADFLETLL